MNWVVTLVSSGDYELGGEEQVNCALPTCWSALHRHRSTTGCHGSSFRPVQKMGSHIVLALCSRHVYSTRMIWLGLSSLE